MDFLKLDDLQYLIKYPQDFSNNKTYPEAAHNSWTPTFSNREVFEWMLSHKKGESNKEFTNEYSDQKKFG